nr:reverse transcriptase domain, reverse transcriptase zinc-binding domain protein [Tanacetum cinerariifolium]
NMKYCDGWLDIISRVQDRISSWKARSLSIEGRQTLIKSFLGCIPLYYLSLFNAPLKDRNKGGLGVGNLLAKNLRLLGKWKWRFLSDVNALWRKVIKNFYGEDGGFGMSRTNGRKRSVWSDIISSINHIDGLDIPFSSSFFKKVSNGVDTLFWKMCSALRVFDPSNCFKVNTLTKLIQDKQLADSILGPQVRWNSWVPRKVNVYVWRASLNRLPSRVNLIAHGINISSSLCPFCEADEESLDHCLINYPKIILIWRTVWSWWHFDTLISIPALSIYDIAAGNVGNLGN